MNALRDAGPLDKSRSSNTPCINSVACGFKMETTTAAPVSGQIGSFLVRRYVSPTITPEAARSSIVLRVSPIHDPTSTTSPLTVPEVISSVYNEPAVKLVEKSAPSSVTEVAPTAVNVPEVTGSSIEMVIWSSPLAKPSVTRSSHVKVVGNSGSKRSLPFTQVCCTGSSFKRSMVAADLKSHVGFL